jgi:hypothetical protein
MLNSLALLSPTATLARIGELKKNATV